MSSKPFTPARLASCSISRNSLLVFWAAAITLGSVDVPGDSISSDTNLPNSPRLDSSLRPPQVTPLDFAQPSYPASYP